MRGQRSDLVAALSPPSVLRAPSPVCQAGGSSKAHVSAEIAHSCAAWRPLKQESSANPDCLPSLYCPGLQEMTAVLSSPSLIVPLVSPMEGGLQ